MAKKKGLKDYWNKFWFLLWKDESPKGWILSLVVIFIFIKFVFFPVLSFVTGTSLPLAIVESCSMYHQGNLLSSYNEWWSNHEGKYSEFNIDENNFQNFRFIKGLNKGDILLIIGAKPEKIKLGDVIIFAAEQRNPVIHRVVDINENNNEFYFSTIGDNNNGQLSFEKDISQDQIIGKASLKIAPYLGWGKLIFFEGKRSSSERGFCK